VRLAQHGAFRWAGARLSAIDQADELVEVVPYPDLVERCDHRADLAGVTQVEPSSAVEAEPGAGDQGSVVVVIATPLLDRYASSRRFTPKRVIVANVSP
jgi:hypothetical protein